MFTVKWIASNGAEMVYNARDVSFTPGGVEGGLNLEPVPLIPGDCIFSVDPGRVTAVRDNGNNLSLTVDCPNAEVLRRVQLKPGEYATCEAEGQLRLGGSHFGALTYDVQGYQRKAGVSFYIIGSGDQKGDVHCSIDSGRVYVMNANGKTVADYVLSTEEFPHGLAPKQAA